MIACDVSDRASVAALLAGRSLSGVVHTAGVVEDATLDRLTPAHIDRVFGPKVDAAWHLHELTLDRPPAVFLLFSSIAGVLGNPGQGNYAAANTTIDAIAEVRRAAGLPAVSVAWGVWTGVGGMAEELDGAGLARLGRSGIGALDADTGLTAFDNALAGGPAVQVASRWNDAGLQARAAGGSLPGILRGLVRAVRRDAQVDAVGPAVIDKLAAASEAEGRTLIADLVIGHVAAVLAHSSTADVDTDRAFSEMGFDSLSAVELRNRLDTATGLRLAATIAFDHPTVTALAEHLYVQLAPTPASAEDLVRAGLDQLDDLITGGNANGGDPTDDTTRTALVALVRSALARWSTNTGRLPEDALHKITTGAGLASDEEIFAFIDKQL